MILCSRICRLQKATNLGLGSGIQMLASSLNLHLPPPDSQMSPAFAMTLPQSISSQPFPVSSTPATTWRPPSTTKPATPSFPFLPITAIHSLPHNVMTSQQFASDDVASSSSSNYLIPSKLITRSRPLFTSLHLSSPKGSSFQPGSAKVPQAAALGGPPSPTVQDSTAAATVGVAKPKRVKGKKAAKVFAVETEPNDSSRETSAAAAALEEKPKRSRRKKEAASAEADSKSALFEGESESVGFTAYKAAREGELAAARQGEPFGSIHLIVGPMFAGKTTELLRRAAWEQAQGRKVAVVKSSIDTRYDKVAVVSHDGHRMPCTAVDSMSAFESSLGSKSLQEVDVIAVDEAQFIRGLAQWCLTAADEYKKTIVLAGLDGDFERKKFGDLVDMVPMVDTVTKLSARCHIEGCERRAHFTFRKSSETAKEVVGGAELYMPVCREHYRDRRRTMAALQAMEAQFEEAMKTRQFVSLDNDVEESHAKMSI